MPFLHEGIYEMILPLKECVETMQGVPHIYVEAVADASLQRLCSFRGQVEVTACVFGAEVREQDAHESFTSYLRHIIRGRRLQELFEQTPLHRASYEADGIIAPLVVDEPLSEIFFESEIEVHGISACKVTAKQGFRQLTE